MDKRDLSTLFRERLKTLLTRSDLNQSAFASAVGIDRSALSQLLSGTSTRLPRAETLLAIAAEFKVSLDWLLGLSQDEGVTGEIRESLEIEEASGSFDRTLLAKWHAEAAGTKIRYVPAGIPDLLRTEALVDYEADITNRNREAQIGETQYRIDYNRRPETDMEVCMPRHTLEIFARGLGVWSGFPEADRREQLLHMAALLEDLYPTFRLFLYDGRHALFDPLHDLRALPRRHLCRRHVYRAERHPADPDADPPFRQSYPRRRDQRARDGGLRAATRGNEIRPVSSLPDIDRT